MMVDSSDTSEYCRPRKRTESCRNARFSALLSRTDLVNVVLLAERVEDDVDLVEHVHHLHGRDVDADLVKLHHVAEQDSHVREDLGCKQT